MGACGNNGFFHPHTNTGGSVVDVGPCSLWDINDSRLAVGQDATKTPIYVDLSKTTPEIIKLPPPAFGSQQFEGTATSVNASGIIVGFASSQKYEKTTAGTYAFIYEKTR